MTIIQSSSIYESMSTTNNCQLQDVPYRACGSTAQSGDGTSTLELGKCNHFRQTYVSDVDEWDATAIDVYPRCLWMMHSEKAPIDVNWWVEALPPAWYGRRAAPIWSELWGRYRMAGQTMSDFGSGDKEELSSKSWEWIRWVNRVLELETGGQ